MGSSSLTNPSSKGHHRYNLPCMTLNRFPSPPKNLIRPLNFFVLSPIATILLLNILYLSPSFYYIHPRAIVHTLTYLCYLCKVMFLTLCSGKVYQLKQQLYSNFLLLPKTNCFNINYSFKNNNLLFIIPLKTNFNNMISLATKKEFITIKTKK